MSRCRDTRGSGEITRSVNQILSIGKTSVTLYYLVFQAALAKLEENCRQEMEKHKQLLDKEYEQLLTQFSKELEKLQLKHQEELGKRLKMNINTEKKLIKEVAQGHENERKSFENKMKAEYKLKKERWKKEMESQETPKSQRNQGNAQCFGNNLTPKQIICHKTEQNRKSQYLQDGLSSYSAHFHF